MELIDTPCLLLRPATNHTPCNSPIASTVNILALAARLCKSNRITGQLCCRGDCAFAATLWLNAMPFSGYANHHDINAMTRALEVYCQERRISDETGRTELAGRIASLFFSGKGTAEEILNALREIDALSQPPVQWNDRL